MADVTVKIPPTHMQDLLPWSILYGRQGTTIHVYHDPCIFTNLRSHPFFLSVVSNIHKRIHMRMETSNAGGLFAGKIGIFESFVKFNPLTLQQPGDFHM